VPEAAKAAGAIESTVYAFEQRPQGAGEGNAPAGKPWGRLTKTAETRHRSVTSVRPSHRLGADPHGFRGSRPDEAGPAESDVWNS